MVSAFIPCPGSLVGLKRSDLSIGNANADILGPAIVEKRLTGMDKTQFGRSS
jgi:hypothetical protein